MNFVQGMLRSHEFLSFHLGYLKKQMVSEFRVFVHHPGHLTRQISNWHRGYSIRSNLEDLPNNNYWFDITISQVRVLRKRPNANVACNINHNDTEIQLREMVTNMIGCIPIYWKSLPSNSLSLSLCNTSTQLSNIRLALHYNISHLLNRHGPPCTDMIVNT